VKIIIVIFFFALGLLLIAMALFGATGVWDKMLFISLEFTRNSIKNDIILLVAGLISWFIGSIVMRTK
jgi:hypothetical protein